MTIEEILNIKLNEFWNMPSTIEELSYARNNIETWKKLSAMIMLYLTVVTKHEDFSIVRITIDDRTNTERTLMNRTLRGVITTNLPRPEEYPPDVLYLEVKAYWFIIEHTGIRIINMEEVARGR